MKRSKGHSVRSPYTSLKDQSLEMLPTLQWVLLRACHSDNMFFPSSDSFFPYTGLYPMFILKKKCNTEKAKKVHYSCWILTYMMNKNIFKAPMEQYPVYNLKFSSAFSPRVCYRLMYRGQSNQYNILENNFNKVKLL